MTRKMLRAGSLYALTMLGAIACLDAAVVLGCVDSLAAGIKALTLAAALHRGARYAHTLLPEEIS